MDVFERVGFVFSSFFLKLKFIFFIINYVIIVIR